MKKPKDYLVFPLDVPALDAALPLVEWLAGHVGMFKVGLELFIRSGPAAVREIRKGRGKETAVFLDLKLHDIPATVGRAMRAAADLGVSYVTVHCGESPKMLEAAVAGSAGQTGVLAVTLLTSVGAGDIRQAGFQDRYCHDLRALVLQRARTARDAGCAGVVCSGMEAAMIRKELGPDFIIVTPGIRPAGDRPGGDDQERVMTPAEAVRNGADYLVIGRPIRDAADPALAAIRIAGEIEAALSKG
ncbi:MAG: orotidine-5'-phosphate decarboxylase [Thermodesulfobacteriota bacterium]